MHTNLRLSLKNKESYCPTESTFQSKKSEKWGECDSLARIKVAHLEILIFEVGAGDKQMNICPILKNNRIEDDITKQNMDIVTLLETEGNNNSREN